MKRHTQTASAFLALVTATVSLVAAAQKTAPGGAATAAAQPRNLIWRDPGKVGVLDLIDGAGGKAHAPDPKSVFTFVKEDAKGTSPKFIVTDGRGVQWKVKMGDEPQSETAATRFLWAAGFFVDEDYYMAEVTVKNLPTLVRGKEFVTGGGVVHGARLERKLSNVTTLDTWDWFDNPFVGQRELNGLRVMMSLLNDWDLKQVNNSIYVVNGEHHYVVSDAGATFGNTGNALTRSKNDPKDYAQSAFIAKDTPDFLDFVLHSRPFFMGVIEPNNYNDRTQMENITKHIPRADAKWLGQRLSQLSARQVRDAFRAAGYAGTDLEILTTTMQQRIAALEAL